MKFLGGGTQFTPCGDGQMESLTCLGMRERARHFAQRAVDAISIFPDGVSSGCPSGSRRKSSNATAGRVTGFAQTLEDTIGKMLDTDGLLTSRTDGINRSIKSFDARIESLEARLVKVEARYSAQFTALDAAMSSMNTTSAYLTQQLATL